MMERGEDVKMGIGLLRLLHMYEGIAIGAAWLCAGAVLILSEARRGLGAVRCLGQATSPHDAMMKG